MALDQLEQYRQDAEAMDRNATIAAFFAGISENESDAEQARGDENTLRRWAALDRQLATGDNA